MIELLRARRSIRKYLGRNVEQEKIEILKEALLRSPSSKNLDPWEFIFIEDNKVISELKKCKPHGTLPLETAPLAIVVCADEKINDVWVEDCSIASIILQLAAQSLGLGSCWVQIRQRNYSKEITSEGYLQKLLSMPENFRILSIITIGYPAELRKGKPFDELRPEKIRINKF